MKKRDYVVYETDDCGNGTLTRVRAKNVVELLKNHFDFPNDEETTEEEDSKPAKKTQADLIYEFEMQCGENNNVVIVLDVKTNKEVIGL